MLDIWKGTYHSEPVCIMYLRRFGQGVELPEGHQEVGGSFSLSETHQARIAPDISPRNRRRQDRSSFERAPRHRRFGAAVSDLYRDSVDARWEHRTVRSGEPGCQPAAAGTCPLSYMAIPLRWEK